jgi:hypothetical protein
MITVDLVKAKEIAHNARRLDREEKMKPHDELIMKQIPNTDVDAVEAKRQLIRDENALLQTQIDEAANEFELKSVMVEGGLL